VSKYRIKHFFSLLLVTIIVAIPIIGWLKLGEVTSPTILGVSATIILLIFLPLFDLDLALYGAVTAGIIGLCTGVTCLIPIALFSDSYGDFRTVAEPVLILFLGQGLVFGFMGGGVQGIRKRLGKLRNKIGNLFNENRNS
jgi:hypothetical protein